MVDVELNIYNRIISELKSKYSWASKVGFSNDFVVKPETFPWVAIHEVDNRTETKYHDTSNEENAARITIQIDVWSNHLTNKKREARKIADAVDCELLHLGFRRTYLNNTPDLQEVSIYRVYGRYTAIVEETDNEFIIYHRP